MYQSDTNRLDVMNVTKTFLRDDGTVHTVIKDLSLSIADLFNADQKDIGEFHVILGKSGCGKSTLLRMVMGLTEITSGSIAVLGKPVTGPDLNCGMVFQQYSSFPWLTVLENVAYGLQIRGVAKSERLNIAKQMMEAVGLSGFETAYPEDLSGGMRQRVAIARTLTLKPAMILMDEPFGALDAQTRSNMQELLLRVWDETACTIVFVTHDVDEAIYLADRIHILGSNPGRLLTTLDVPFGRPRCQHLKETPEFRQIVQQILTVLKTQ